MSATRAHHATFLEAIDRLDYIQDLGFDIVYLPPIHPIGRSHRKGPNNSRTAGADDVGSPWAIGSELGGHDAIDPGLGTEDDLRQFIDAAQRRGLEVALDIAFQCSPDHPWVTQHPEWFHIRADGSVACAENPPKLYEDIVPLDFSTPQWFSLWNALADVVRRWRGVGIRVFRVDNPHTKPFPFWEWLIAEMRREDPNVIFLAEAFATPAVLAQLAKVGFTQSYTHFPWQYAPHQLREYFTWLTSGETGEVVRANSWPNTPDILTGELQQGVRSAYVERLVLAATLSSCYGIYGPAFELMRSTARTGAEEYVDNEKYQLVTWSLDDPSSLRDEIALVNSIRRTHSALQHDRSLAFHTCDNERIVAYSKSAPARVESNAYLSHLPILVVANTDHWNTQVGTVRLTLDALGLGLGHDDEYEVTDLLNGATYRWRGASNVVILDPARNPVHVFRVRPLDPDAPTGGDHA